MLIIVFMPFEDHYNMHEAKMSDIIIEEYPDTFANYTHRTFMLELRLHDIV